MENIAKGITAVCVIVLGMYGLVHGVEYSGWILFVGCLVAAGI